MVLPKMLRIVLLVVSLPALAAAAPKPTIAVTYFENNTGKAAYDALSRGLADMLITDFGSLSGLQVVERARLNDLMKEIELAKGPYFDVATAAKMGRGLGARYVLTGSFASIAPTMRIDARVVDVRSGKVVYATKASGPTDQFFLLEKELALGLVQGIGLKLSVRESAKLGRVATESFDAFKAWSAGLEALDRGEIEVARLALEKALKKDSGFGAARTALEGTEARFKALGRTRRKLFSSDTAVLVKKLAEIKANKGPYESLPQIMEFGAIVSSMPAGARKVREITRLLLDMKLPEEIRFGGAGYRVSVNGWALANYVIASYYLRAHADIVTYGEAFMKRYPRSTFFTMVEGFVRLTINDLKTAEAGRRRMPEFRTQADLHRKRLRCQQRRRPAAKVRDCAKWVASLAAAKDKDLEVGLRALLKAAENAPEPELMALAKKTIHAASQDAVVLKRLERLEAITGRKYERANAAHAEIARVICTRHPMRQRRLAACRERVTLSRSLHERELKSALLSVLSEARKSGHRPPDMIAAADFVTQLSRDASIRKQADDLRGKANERTAAAVAAGSAHPANARAAARAARTLWTAGRAKEAFRLVERMLAQFPTEYGLHDVVVDLALDKNDLGAARAAAKRYDRAVNTAGAGRRQAMALTRNVESRERKIKSYDDSLARAHRDRTEDLFVAGRRKQARELLDQGLKLFPTDQALHKAAVAQATKAGDVVAAHGALLRWKKAVGENGVDPYASKNVAELGEKLLNEADVEGDVLRRLAGEMGRANLWREAANIYLRLARDYPKSRSAPEAQSLLDAARYYHNAGDSKTSRKLYDELLRRFESSTQASQARNYLMALPR